MATSIFEKETSTEEKKKLLSILNEISNFSGIEIIPMRVSSNVKVLLGKKYLDVLSDIEDPKWGAEYLFDIETRMLIFQEYAKVKDLYYDLSKKEFISAELCRAVDKNKLQYTSALIDYSMGMIDIGKIRCIEHKGTMIEFLGNTEGIGSDSEVKSMLGVCPMSLRRVSGTNYASAVSARINSFRNNYEEVDPNKIKSYSDAVTKIKKSIAQGISKTPKLSPVPGNMNALLDEYDNTWMFGGDCSLESNARFH
jgi:hypothetical protein